MYKIVGGSSCDLTEEMIKELDIELIPFKITIDDSDYVDDENLDINSMVDHMNSSKDPVRTACPAPGDFLKVYEKYDDVFVLTISSKLSGAYNSAMVAKEMALEKNPDKFIHIFDTKSASAGETLVAFKLKEEIDKGISKEEIIENVNRYIDNMKTFFILESLDNLIKNGRISKTKGLIASVLNFKPIMSDGGDGNIELFEKVRGKKRAFSHLVKSIGNADEDFSNRVLAITHVRSLDLANELKLEIGKKYNFKDIKVVQTAGLCSSYADDGGIVLAY